MLRKLLIFLPLLLPEFATAESLYKIYGSRGSVTFTSRAPRKGERYKVVAPKRPVYSSVIRRRGWSFRAMRSKFDPLIRETASQYAFDAALVKAVIHAESSFDPGATSHKGAMGLMQLMPATAKRFGVQDAYRPAENVRGGVEYLQFLYKRYNGNLRLTLAAYNAGEGVVDRLKAVPPYRETQHYVRKVLALHEEYKKQIDERKS